ncbi:hypothetical protein GCM10009552_19330 [Rothia nasimurium]|uniref:P-type conjugative transfer protein TrbJ n=1 Tax=Luteibacter anthropi TaxID=564369 RepID=A0A7X5ZHY2_9GAMM|nr:hypothetical protein [Luteibacter anthropi]NII06277.1 hypothetical protein [Luteibacter anthropi]
MNTKQNKRQSWVGYVSRVAIAIGMTVAVGMYAAPTKAQWIVNDPLSMGKSIEEFLEQAKRWGETAKHYTDQVAFWQNNLIKLQSLQYDLLRTQQQFQKVDDNFGVAEKCPGASLMQGDITSALTSVLGKLSGDYKSQQDMVCVLIARTYNQRYNNTVDYLQQVSTQTGFLSQLAQMRLTSVGDSPGKLQALQDDTARFNVNVQQARDSWKTTDEQLTAQITALEDKQKTLSRIVLKGAPSPLGTVVNAGILKAALEVH